MNRIILLASILSLLGNTVPATITDTHSFLAESTANVSYEVKTKTFQREAKSKDGQLVLTCKYAFPWIKTEKGRPDHIRILSVNQQIEKESMNQFGNACKEAVDFTNEFIGEIYQGDKKVPWLPFQVDFSYEITRNKNQWFSYLVTEFRWLGGAHPDTQYQGYIYDLSTAKLVKPVDLLKKSAKEIKQYIADEMMKLYKENPSYYFEDEVKELQKLKFEYNSYLNDEGIVFFFNAYEVAPYVTGKVEIPLKYQGNESWFKDNLY